VNIKTALNKGAKKIKDKILESAENEAEMILSFILKKNREFLFTYPEKKLNFWQSARFNRLIKRRVSGVPLAYLTGRQGFYGLDFIVDKNVLIPRPETELLVEEALKKIKNYELRIKNVIDVGTGSGCVIVSLAKNFPASGINFYGLDISRKALAVAKKNADQNSLKNCIHFLYSDLLNNIDKSIFNEPVLVMANLPYLTAEQIKNSPTIRKEPEIALWAGIDGLSCYRQLFRQISAYSNLIENKLFLLCEIDETQSLNFKKIAEKIIPRAKITIKKDLSGFDRLAVIKF
jgi:release factor glutamine methyltransferase